MNLNASDSVRITAIIPTRGRIDSLYRALDSIRRQNLPEGVAFRLFRELLPAPRRSSGHRVLIYGAGDAGELLARELLNNASLQCTPIGFADDDPLKKGKIIHGLRVFGGNGSFLTICGQHAIDEVLISSMRFTPERLDEIARECTTLSLPLRRMRFQIEALDDGTGSAARSLLNRLGQPDPYLA